MSLGKSLLASVIAEGNRSAVRDLKAELFIEDEIPAFDYFMSFYRRYGGMPTLQNMAQAGHLLTPAMGPTLYMLDRCVQRAIYNSVRDTLPSFQIAFQQQNIPELQRTLGRMALAANDFTAGSDVQSLHEAALRVMESHAEARAQIGELTGVTTGFHTLDDATNGAQPGEVFTWVARPNIGKSYTLAHVAKSAWRAGHSVLFVTMEMTMPSMSRRIIGVMSDINPDYIKRGTLSTFGEESVYETIRELEHGAPFTMVAGNLSKSVSQVDALVQEYNPDVIVIDASYLLEPTERRKGRTSMHETLADVGKEVTQMALARRRPVHQSVQFNRAQKKGVEGDLSNIGGTDVVGQISTVVIGISEGETPYETTRRKYEVIKNRDGNKPTFYTNFRFDPLDFSELIPEESEDVDDLI